MELLPTWSPRNYSLQAICCRACNSFIVDESHGVGENVWNLLFCALDLHNVHLINNQLICRCGIPVGDLVHAIFEDYCYQITQKFYTKTMNEGNGIIRAMTVQVRDYPMYGFFGCLRCYRPIVASEIIPIMTIGGLQFNPFDCANLGMRRGLNGTVQRHLVCFCSSVVGEIFGTLNAVLYSDCIVNFQPNYGHNLFGIRVTRYRGNFITVLPHQEQPLMRVHVLPNNELNDAAEFSDEDDSGYENSDFEEILQ